MMDAHVKKPKNLNEFLAKSLILRIDARDIELANLRRQVKLYTCEHCKTYPCASDDNEALACFSCGDVVYCDPTCAYQDDAISIPASDIVCQFAISPHRSYYHYAEHIGMLLAILCKKCSKTCCNKCGEIKDTDNCACPK